ncbi:MAG: hypothetical protein WCJ30_06745 [Deltaproteobacteria bacterium]
MTVTSPRGGWFSSVRPLLGLGVATLAAAVFAWSWDLLAHQVPSSSLRVQGYPAAIDRLAQHAWVEAALLFALGPAAFANELAHAPARARTVNLAALVGTVLALGSLAVSARTGVLAQQLRDTSALASALLVARLAGDGLLLVALTLTVRGVMRGPPAPPAAAPPS